MEDRVEADSFCRYITRRSRASSDSARETAGFQLFKVQQGQEPDDWKPMPMVGSGIQELRISDKGNAYRVIVLAKFEEAVYVLHVFQKRSQKTAKSDLRLAKSRYADLMSWRKG